MTRYYVATWDSDKQEHTPQKGVRTGPYSLFGLRKALGMGYGIGRISCAGAVNVWRVDK